uniref:C2H2-type domain-containing protein n=1 Tax=Anopheles culicifacies TaxID=139723 RepID=A0A182MMF1_9DIPT
MLVASAESTAYESAESEKEEERSDDPLDHTVFEDMLLDEDISCEPIHSPHSIVSSEQPNEDDDDMYCANYIEPGTSYHSESDDIWETEKTETKKPRKKYTYKKYACSVQEPVVQQRIRKKKTYEFSALTQSQCYYVKKYKDVTRMYMKALCEICGKLVSCFSNHMETHTGSSWHSCPHCPVKMKKKTNLSAHIKTVHYKIVGKTCNICGKGFVHHKTYRYHMVEFLEDDTDAIESSTVIQQDLNETQQLDCDYQNRTEEPPIENEDICESNNSVKESRLMNHHDIGNELAEQSVATNTAIDKVCEDETLYSANYIALGEPYSDNEEPDWYHDEISTDDDALYAMCMKCTNSLKTSATFRAICLNNNSLFHELSTVLATSAESIYGETIEYLDSEFEEDDDKDYVKIEEKPFPELTVEPFWDAKRSPEHAYEEEYIQDSQDDTNTSLHEEQLSNVDEFTYSANRIEPGESFSDDDVYAPNFFMQSCYKKLKKSPKGLCAPWCRCWQTIINERFLLQISLFVEDENYICATGAAYLYIIYQAMS